MAAPVGAEIALDQQTLTVEPIPVGMYHCPACGETQPVQIRNEQTGEPVTELEIGTRFGHAPPCCAVLEVVADGLVVVGRFIPDAPTRA